MLKVGCDDNLTGCRSTTDTKASSKVAVCSARNHGHVAKILRRDISAGNIILSDHDEGLSIHWDLDIGASETGNGELFTYDHSSKVQGTWWLMSAALFRDVGKPRELRDDIESFVHVLGWTTASFVATTSAYPAGAPHVAHLGLTV
ncbi:hypothetical protein BS17DRAFT_777100 [Gyrodon lividus]|nr:hypothetical protein BS17DRAFT_777100 [Gyrodon lividus]